MKKNYFLFLLLSSLLALQASLNVAFSQVQYSLSSFSGQTYTPLTGGTVINSTSQLSPGQSKTADDGTVLVTLPFSFSYNGNPYSEVTFCTNGWIGMGNQTTITASQCRSGSGLFSNTSPNNTIAAWFKDGSANFPAPNGTGSMVHGFADSGVYAFEWKNATGYGYSLTTVNTINYMIKLYGPASAFPGRIEILHGTQTGTFSGNASIGLDDDMGYYINAANGQTNSNVTSAVWPGNGNGFRFDPWQPCSGSPIGGSTISSRDTICAATPFILTVSNSSSGSGLTYQWQNSIDTISWNDIAGQTMSTYNVSSGISQTTWFRRVTTCSGMSSNSDPVLITVKEPSLCYCTTTATGSSLHTVTGNPNIDSVSISGTTLINTNTGAPAGGITQFPASGNTTASLVKGATYSLTVKLSSSGDGSAWIDWNRNGVYETTEWLLVAGRTAGGTVSFMVPTNAAAGMTGLRIRSRTSGSGNDSTSACKQFGSGETEEYLLTIQEAQPCTGSPASVSISGPSQVCPGGKFSLTASNFTYASGLSFQWQSSPAGQNNWNDRTGDTLTSISVSQTAATDYRIMITCNGSNPILSDSMTVTLKTAGCPPVNDEPCNALPLPVSPTDSCQYKQTGTTVLATTSTGYGYYNPVGCAVGYAPKDVWYKVTTDSTGAGSSSLYFRLAKTAGSTMTTGTMILFSANGNCPKPTLTYQGTCKNSTSGFPPYIMKASNLLPNTTYYLRVSPCADSDPVGEFEVCAYIPPPAPPCVQKVYPGPADTVPYNQVVTFKWRQAPGATGYSFYLGDTYPPAFYSNSTDTVETKTFAAYNRKYYWKVVPNTIYGPATSCEIDSLVTQLPPSNCVPMTSFGCTYGDTLKLFTLLGEDSTIISQSSGCASGGYTNYTTGASAKLYRGNAYSGTFMTSNQTNYVTIWIDFNSDGQFSNDERLLNNLRVAGKNVLTNYTINIPATAPLGNHRLRVRNIYWPYVNVHATDPCNFYTFTETEDYSIRIDTPVYATRPLVSRGMDNNCMTVGSLTVDDSSNNTNDYIMIVDKNNQVVASINANGNNLGYVNATLFKNSGAIRSTSSGLKLIDRNLFINSEKPPVTPVNIRLYFTDGELEALRNADPQVLDRTYLDITKTETGCSGGISGIGTAIPQSSSGVYGSDHYVEFMVSQFSSFYLNRGNRALPVTFISFTGERNGSINNLYWKTINESNNEGFEIQRSADGINFTGIAFIPSKAINGYSTNELGYSYADNSLHKGTLYYRLKQIDKNGRYKFSSIVTIKGNRSNEFVIGNIYPNPAKDIIALVISSPSAENISLMFTDIAGRIVDQRKFQLIAGENTIRMPVASLSKGTYLIKVQSHDGINNVIQKFVKE